MLSKNKENHRLISSSETECSFAHLHLHSEYSLLDGMSRIKEIVGRVKELGMDSVALTDHGVMHGVIHFYKEAKKQGIHPILGCETYIAPRSRLDKDSRQDAANYHMVLLAENNTGYHNLMKLISHGFVDGFYYKPRIDMALLEQYSEGLIGLSACLGGHISQLILQGAIEEAKQTASEYQRILGKDNYYLELQRHYLEPEKKVNQTLIEISQELSIPLVITNDSHYTYAEDEEAHDVLICIQTNRKVGETGRMSYIGGEYYIKSPQEMYRLFAEQDGQPVSDEQWVIYEQAFKNTTRIAKRCQVELTFGELKLPQYDVPDRREANVYLRELSYQGLQERYPTEYRQYLERLDYELSVIEEMGYVDYYLIVWDFIKYARDHDIIVGPGRGSAAGSLVAYSLMITDIDPIRYQLIFERFLNPERVSMPDIDIDFCYERRQEVIDYVVEKYGNDRVAQIITFGTMAARAVIRDVGRAMDIPYKDVDKVAKMIPMELKMTIDKALQVNGELYQLYEEDGRIEELINTSRRLEGLTRHSSTHAAGVVICDRPVSDYVPLYAHDGAISTQFTMGTLEELGLLKMDFLGLRTLTVIQDTVNQINRERSEDASTFTIQQIDEDDPLVFELIAAGKTEGVFQLESSGMKSFMKELKPQNLEDIIAGISLYRPGPMSSIPAYVKGRHYSQEVSYVCPELEPILKTTYGCIVYQEQVMQIVRDLAGYTLGRSDLVRRAMSKKKNDVMEEERRNFIYGNQNEGIDGCLARGVSESAAKQIYDDMADFAKYAFNKSHAAAYAIIAYQTAYLKRYYPVEFMAALITSVISNSDKTAEYIGLLKEMGIRLLKPDINQGEASFSVKDGAICYGLAAIKNVGQSVIDNMVAERQKGGPYRSLTDYCLRLSSKDLNKRSVESLIKAGAFDSLENTRRHSLESYAGIIKGVQTAKRTTIAGQVDLFGHLMAQEEPKGTLIEEDKWAHPLAGGDVRDTGTIAEEEYTLEKLLALEKEVTGLYLSGHPLEQDEEWLKRVVSHTSADFVFGEGEATFEGMNEEERVSDGLEDDKEVWTKTVDDRLVDGQKVVVGGLIHHLSTIMTKNNSLMAFIEVEDLRGSFETIVFPRVYEQWREILYEDNKVLIRGRVSVQADEQIKVIADRIETFEKLIKSTEVVEPKRAKKEMKLWLALTDQKEYQTKADYLKSLLQVDHGDLSVYVYFKSEKCSQRLHYRVSGSKKLMNDLIAFLGKDNVKKR